MTAHGINLSIFTMSIIHFKKRIFRIQSSFYFQPFERGKNGNIVTDNNCLLSRVAQLLFELLWLLFMNKDLFFWKGKIIIFISAIIKHNRCFNPILNASVKKLREIRFLFGKLRNFARKNMIELSVKPFKRSYLTYKHPQLTIL